MLKYRDSAVWWSLLCVATAGFLAAHFDAVAAAFPGVSHVWQARLELASVVGIFVAGYARMSPLMLSPDSELAGLDADPSKTLTVTGKDPLQQPDKLSKKDGDR